MKDTQDTFTKDTQDTNEKKYICEKCGVTIKHKSNYYRHKKKCQVVQNKELIQTELQTKLLQAEIQNKLLQDELTKFKSNSDTEQFNLKSFLNKCNAITMQEFIDSIELNITDLENIEELGYVEGVSKNIIKRLKALNSQQPIYCSDLKRKTFYIKEEKWKKNVDQMINLVMNINKKNYILLQEWKTLYPNCDNSMSKYNDKYINLVINIVDGSSENIDKVINKIAREVVI
jgi:hypothetical protein